MSFPSTRSAKTRAIFALEMSAFGRQGLSSSDIFGIAVTEDCIPIISRTGCNHPLNPELTPLLNSNPAKNSHHPRLSICRPPCQSPGTCRFVADMANTQSWSSSCSAKIALNFFSTSLPPSDGYPYSSSSSSNRRFSIQNFCVWFLSGSNRQESPPSS